MAKKIAKTLLIILTCIPLFPFIVVGVIIKTREIKQKNKSLNKEIFEYSKKLTEQANHTLKLSKNLSKLALNYTPPKNGQEQDPVRG